MDALSISSNVELNELDAYVASMKYIYLLVKGIIEIIKNGVNTLMRGWYVLWKSYKIAPTIQPST